MSLFCSYNNITGEARMHTYLAPFNENSLPFKERKDATINKHHCLLFIIYFYKNVFLFTGHYKISLILCKCRVQPLPAVTSYRENPHDSDLSCNSKSLKMKKEIQNSKGPLLSALSSTESTGKYPKDVGALKKSRIKCLRHMEVYQGTREPSSRSHMSTRSSSRQKYSIGLNSSWYQII